MKDKVDTARQGLHQFFENCNPDDDYFVIGFSDYPALLADATHSTASIEDNAGFRVPPRQYGASRCKTLFWNECGPSWSVFSSDKGKCAGLYPLPCNQHHDCLIPPCQFFQ
jgi:hypothetical protein